MRDAKVHCPAQIVLFGILMRFLFLNMYTCNTRIQHAIHKQCTSKLAFKIVEHSLLVPLTERLAKIE